jgi:hypothetical protein
MTTHSTFTAILGPSGPPNAAETSSLIPEAHQYPGGGSEVIENGLLTLSIDTIALN